MTERLERAQAAMQHLGIDALAVAPGTNLLYLTGLGLHTKLRLTLAVIPQQGQPGIVLPAMEAPRVQAALQTPARLYPWADGADPTQALMACVRDLGLRGGTVGVEGYVMRVFELRALEAALPGAQVADATDLIAGLRMLKDAHELAAMRAAVQVIEAALAHAIAQVRIGITERELAAIWEDAIRAAGSLPSFDTTVASGPNGANPHHANSDRPFQAGDLVVLDGGAIVDHYCSDITRTVAVGEPGPEQRRIYELVQQANAAGRAVVQPGVTGEQVDLAARQVIDAGGYGPQFVHRTGHGLGLDVHEPPFMVAGAHMPLQPGMTFTVEPGIYVPGRCGVRIEDDVLVTETGVESLTSFPRDLLVLG